MGVGDRGIPVRTQGGEFRSHVPLLARMRGTQQLEAPPGELAHMGPPQTRQEAEQQTDPADVEAGIPVRHCGSAIGGGEGGVDGGAGGVGGAAI